MFRVESQDFRVQSQGFRSNSKPRTECLSETLGETLSVSTVACETHRRPHRRCGLLSIAYCSVIRVSCRFVSVSHSHDTASVGGKCDRQSHRCSRLSLSVWWLGSGVQCLQVHSRFTSSVPRSPTLPMPAASLAVLEPHGGVRPSHQKSTCITQLTWVVCGENLVTYPPPKKNSPAPSLAVLEPHGGGQPSHQKSTCISQFTLKRYVVQTRSRTTLKKQPQRNPRSPLSGPALTSEVRSRFV